MGRQGDDHSTARFKARNPFCSRAFPFGRAAGPEPPGRRRCLARALACFFCGGEQGRAPKAAALAARGARAPLCGRRDATVRAPAPQGHTSTFRGACASAQDARGRSRPALHSVLPAASRGARSRAPPRGGRRELAPTAGPEASAPSKRCPGEVDTQRCPGGHSHSEVSRWRTLWRCPAGGH